MYVVLLLLFLRDYFHISYVSVVPSDLLAMTVSFPDDSQNKGEAIHGGKSQACYFAKVVSSVCALTFVIHTLTSNFPLGVSSTEKKFGAGASVAVRTGGPLKNGDTDLRTHQVRDPQYHVVRYGETNSGMSAHIFGSK